MFNRLVNINIAHELADTKEARSVVPGEFVLKQKPLQGSSTIHPRYRGNTLSDRIVAILS